VFGFLKRGGKVYTEIVPDCAKATLQGIIRSRVRPDSVIHSDGWRVYNSLVDPGFKKYIVSTMELMNLLRERVTSMALNLSAYTRIID